MDNLPVGGSLTEMLAKSDDGLDAWIEHVQARGASTPELMVMLLCAIDEKEQKVVLTALLATAIQRLVQETNA